MIPLVALSSFVQRNKSPDSSLPSGSIMSENDSVGSASYWREF